MLRGHFGRTVVTGGRRTITGSAGKPANFARLPRTEQLVNGLPSDFQTASIKFSRFDFLDPTRRTLLDTTARNLNRHDRAAIERGATVRREKLDDGAAEDADALPVGAPIAAPVEDSRLRVALVGGTNSGKSYLFNHLVGAFSRDTGAPRLTAKQLVKDFHGLTRDSIEAIGKLEDLIFTVVDTPGTFEGSVMRETEKAVRSCHICLFLVSSEAELGPNEAATAEWLRKNAPDMPIITIVSKIDLARHRAADVLEEVESHVGLGGALGISALTTEGLSTLSHLLRPLADMEERARTYRDWKLEDAALNGDVAALESIRTRNAADTNIRVAFVGRTNSGKSSLINSLIGRHRSRASASRITTRDAVETTCTFRGRQLQLIDTGAVMRARHRRDRAFLHEVHNSTIEAIKYAHVVVIVFDATEGHPSSYDMALAHTCIDEGRPFVFAAHKWDSVLDASATAEAIDFKLKRQINEVRYACAVVTSSVSTTEAPNEGLRPKAAPSKPSDTTGLNLSLLLDQAVAHYDRWNKMVPSGELTRFWRRLERTVTIPAKITRVHRIVQSHARPPTFIVRLQSRDAEDGELKQMYVNLLRNALVEEFDFKGVPLRFIQQAKLRSPDIV
jgi:GTP-binding protein